VRLRSRVNGNLFWNVEHVGDGPARLRNVCVCLCACACVCVCSCACEFAANAALLYEHINLYI